MVMVMGAWPMPWVAMLLQYEARATVTFPAWFKNAHFRVTLGLSARTLIGPALERVYASPWLPSWGFRSARIACT
ncbi:MAG: hypothetical protein ACXVCF_13260, partial [Isosphaeraceae bacterium]